MSDTTGGGIQVPTIDDDPNIPRDVLKVVTDIEPSLLFQFATTTERDAAYTAVGFSVCTVAGVLQQRVGSEWRPAPRGAVKDGQVSGPPTQLDMGSTFSNIIGISATLYGGRTYEVTASIRGQQITASGIPIAYFAQATDGTSELVSAARLIDGTETRAVNAFVSGTSTALINPGATGTFTVFVVVRTTAGAVRFSTNSCRIWIKDIGAS